MPPRLRRQVASSAPLRSEEGQGCNGPGAKLARNQMTPASADLNGIARRYRAFAIDEARGVSKVYENLALGIVASSEILGFIASVPADRRQPNLFLAAVRHVCGVPENTTHLRSLLRQEHERSAR